MKRMCSLLTLALVMQAMIVPCAAQETEPERRREWTPEQFEIGSYVEVRYLQKAKAIQLNNRERTAEGYVESVTDRLTINAKGKRILLPYPDILEAKITAKKATDLGLIPGTRVRLTFPPDPIMRNRRKIFGKIVSVDGDTLKLVERRSLEYRTLSVDLNDLKELEIGSGSRGFKYMAVGLLSGAAFGAVVGFSQGGDPPGFLSFSAGDKAALGAIAFGGIGLAVGTICALLSREKWRPVSLHQVQEPPLGIDFLPAHKGRITLTASLTF